MLTERGFLPALRELLDVESDLPASVVLPDLLGGFDRLLAANADLVSIFFGSGVDEIPNPARAGHFVLPLLHVDAAMSGGGQTALELMVAAGWHPSFMACPQLVPGCRSVGRCLLAQLVPALGGLASGEPRRARSPRLGATYLRTPGVGTGPKSSSLGADRTAASSGSASTSAGCRQESITWAT